MSVCALMNWLVLQEDVGYAAVGRPQPSGFGLEPATSEGMEERGKNQMKIPEVFQFIAYTPPPFCANEDPYDAPGTSTIHPWLPFV